jgi:hypothetical protein
MLLSQEQTKFEFIVSTPSHNASSQKSTQRLVRKHVMRPWKRRKSPPRTVILQDEDLTKYLTQRERHRMEVSLTSVSALCFRNSTIDSGASSCSSSSASPTPPIPAPPGGLVVLSPGSPSISAALLGASRLNPFGGYPINMSRKELEMVHHSELLELAFPIALFGINGLTLL